MIGTANGGRSLSDKYLIAELANHNIRDMFEMIKQIMKTHIANCTEIPIRNLIRQHTATQNQDSSDDTLETLRHHLVIWALMLKDNSLYYRNQKDKTWLMNIYHVEHPAESYFLKRLILDFLSTTRERGFKYVYSHQIEDVFHTEMEFDIPSIDRCLFDLSDSKNTNPLVSVIRNEHRIKYSLTPKGALYSSYISELYTYIELIIEDMLLPLKQANNNRGLDIKLLPFEPLLHYGSPEERRLEINKYFDEKQRQVLEFMTFLECREMHEKESHHDFFSVKEGFQGNYFPAFRVNIEKQISKISNALIYDYA